MLFEGQLFPRTQIAHYSLRQAEVSHVNAALSVQEGLI